MVKKFLEKQHSESLHLLYEPNQAKLILLTFLAINSLQTPHKNLLPVYIIEFLWQHFYSQLFILFALLKLHNLEEPHFQLFILFKKLFLLLLYNFFNLLQKEKHCSEHISGKTPFWCYIWLVRIILESGCFIMMCTFSVSRCLDL